jgi:4-diphosphocytidyl-2-C-methyl-D-erythritol kinase
VSAPEVVRLAARAKINLSLRVLGKRKDGFHDISTVMQSLDWFDDIEMRRAPATTVSIERGPELFGPLPGQPDLVERTIGLIDQTLGGTQAAEVHVVKNLPVAAGLGGGSADAAAAILGMNVLTGEAMSSRQMLEIAAQAGSDVPFALVGGAGVARGRGEIIERLDHRRTWWVIAVPDFRLRTAEVYERWDELGRPSSDKGALPSSEDPEELATLIHNDLEAAAFAIRPALRELKEEVVRAGPIAAVVSGSGPAIAGLCRDRNHGDAISANISGDFRLVKVVASAARGVEVVDPAS